MRFAACLGVCAVVGLFASLAVNLPSQVGSSKPNPSSGNGLLYPRPVPLASLSLAELERWQVAAHRSYRGAWLVHERVAARRPLSRTEFTHRRWFRLATAWTWRELGETRERIRLRREWTQGPSSGVWYEIAVCESGSRPPSWHINTGNGFYGGLQFLTSTWLAYGGGRYAPRADLASPGQQVAIASGMSLTHWPVCGAPYR